MPSEVKRPRVPKYREHHSGPARITIAGKDYYLGRYGSQASRDAYDRLIQKWLANDRQLEATTVRVDSPDGPSVGEVCLAYWKHAEQSYGLADKSRGDGYCIRHALRIVKNLYADAPAVEFGPKALKRCRDSIRPVSASRMISAPAFR